MSAETTPELLRRAAWHMRNNNSVFGATRDQLTMLAVADLLELDADCVTPPEYDESQDAGRHFLRRIARAYLDEAMPS